MTKAVLFDFTQTLVDSSAGFRAAEKQAEVRICEDLGAPWETFLSDYRALRSQFDERAPNFSRSEMWEAVYSRYAREPDPAALGLWEREYWGQVRDATRPFPETIRVLGRLAEQFKLALVTNCQGPGVSEDHGIDRLPRLREFFDVVVVAGEGGVPSKPDSAPFRLCLERLGLLPAEAVHVGDDWRIDVVGAQGAGIRPVWLKHRALRRHWPAGEPSVPVIDTLDALLDLDDLLAGAGADA